MPTLSAACSGTSSTTDSPRQTFSVPIFWPSCTVAGFLGESGFEAIRPDVQRQQGVAVELTDLVPGEFALAVIFIVVGIGLDDMPRELGELARGHELSGVGKPGRIAEGRFGQSKL